VQARPVPPSQRTELPVPRELDDLVLACLEKNPDNRPRDAQELFRAACGFTSCDGWTSDAARIWWELHLPELSGPPQPVEPRHEVVGAPMFV
jgi:serine/threonine protein kinase